MINVIAISSGMLSPKKGSQRFRYAHNYLNYGLLGLASSLPVEIPVYHGHFLSPLEFLEKYSSITKAKVILISLPSFYAVPWTIEFLNYLFSKKSSYEVHVGGRWVIDQNYEFIRKCFPKSVFIHKGLGEKTISYLSNKWYNKNLLVNSNSISTSRLNYKLLVGCENFHPSIEISRGCGMGCHFCEEGNVPRTSTKEPVDIIDEIKDISSFYTRHPNFYFENSIFAPNNDWCTKFLDIYRESNVSFFWRTESRVDALSPKKIETLAKAGLQILDLGLESASPSQIINMGKSKNPDAYLSKAITTLKACKDNNIKTKINILLYPGESERTINETKEFLQKNHDSIFGISAHPVVVYGTGERLKSFEELYIKLGAKGLEATGVNGVWDVNLSKEINSKMAKVISNEFAKEFMPMKNYYYLKSFSYFDPSYTWEMFAEDEKELLSHNRPFGY